MSEVQLTNPAEQASQRALTEVFTCLEGGKSFLLEAGAGAGKTYSLVQALRFVIDRNQIRFSKRHQRVACITFTNVAKDEIIDRTDGNPLIHCDTIHAFCWSVISAFQKQLREILPQLNHWPERLEQCGGLGDRRVEYTRGHRSISDEAASIHHDDVLPFTIALMNNAKFRRIFSDKYPVILIDEYQDTDADWIEAIKTHFLGQPGSPLFGFFGDEWQKIYGNGCGKVEHPQLVRIGKGANFRSVSTIVTCLNKMRPDLPQFVVNPDDTGSVHVFHTNNWGGRRQTGPHWGGDLPPEVAHTALSVVLERLSQQGWDLSPGSTKVLMLTHRVLASEQGYQTLPQVFRYNESFTKKEHGHIEFFVDHLEPACEAYLSRKYGEMFEALGASIPAIKGHVDKERWSVAMDALVTLRNGGTVGRVIEHLRRVRRPRLPDSLEHLEQELERFDRNSGEEMPAYLRELEALHAVPYHEIIALTRYLRGHSPFETKHGVKGAEFENVLVVVGRGWNQYNFNELLELAQDVDHIPTKRLEAFERSRNLFYVACSRPKRRLAILFTQELTPAALRTVEHWFGAEGLEALAI